MQVTHLGWAHILFSYVKKQWCELNTFNCLPQKQWILTYIWPNVFQWEILGPRSPEDLKLSQPPPSDHHRRPIDANGSHIGTKPVRERLFPNPSIISSTTTDRHTINHNLNFNNLTTSNNIITTILKNGGTEDKRKKDDRMIILE